jgi:hypothetical protein
VLGNETVSQVHECPSIRASSIGAAHSLSLEAYRYDTSSWRTLLSSQAGRSPPASWFSPFRQTPRGKKWKAFGLEAGPKVKQAIQSPSHRFPPPSPVVKRSFLPEAFVKMGLTNDRFSTPSHAAPGRNDPSGFISMTYRAENGRVAADLPPNLEKLCSGCYH